MLACKLMACGVTACTFSARYQTLQLVLIGVEFTNRSLKPPRSEISYDSCSLTKPTHQKRSEGFPVDQSMKLAVNEVLFV